jgi:hypothetical protein
LFEQAVHPLTPEGVLEQVRLDKVVIVEDGALPNPYPSNFPADDTTVDIIWGIPSEMVGVPSTHPQYGPGYIDFPEGQTVDYALLHEMSHARYLIDLYTLNIVADRSYLEHAIGSEDKTFSITDQIENSPLAIPAQLAMEGEYVICNSATDRTYSDCQRGAEGTSARPHAGGSLVNRAVVQVQDGKGNLVMGSSSLPFVGFWNDHLYYNRYGEDMMSGARFMSSTPHMLEPHLASKTGVR